MKGENLRIKYKHQSHDQKTFTLKLMHANIVDATFACNNCTWSHM
jgi:hypothetical protein